MFSRKGFPQKPGARAFTETFRLDRVRVCRTMWTRMRGLLGTTQLASDEGCLLYPCASVHSFGMKFPIDVIYLSADRKVVRIVKKLMPWRVSSGPSGAYAVLEVRAGVARGIEVGDTVRFVEIDG